MFNVEELAEKLHEWYLEAIKEIDNKFYNPDANVPYSELLEVQRNIDRHIAKKLLECKIKPEYKIPTSLDEVYKEIMRHIKEMSFIVLEFTFRIPFRLDKDKDNIPIQDIEIKSRGILK